MKIGDRVRTDIGMGTIVEILPGKELCILVKHDEEAGLWHCRVDELELIEKLTLKQLAKIYS